MRLGGQTFLDEGGDKHFFTVGRGTDIFTHQGGKNIFTPLGRQTFLHEGGKQTISVGDGGGSDNDDVDKKMYVRKTNNRESKASKLSAGARIFRGP